MVCKVILQAGKDSGIVIIRLTTTDALIDASIGPIRRDAAFYNDLASKVAVDRFYRLVRHTKTVARVIAWLTLFTPRVRQTQLIRVASLTFIALIISHANGLAVTARCANEAVLASLSTTWTS